MLSVESMCTIETVNTSINSYWAKPCSDWLNLSIRLAARDCLYFVQRWAYTICLWGRYIDVWVKLWRNHVVWRKRRKIGSRGILEKCPSHFWHGELSDTWKHDWSYALPERSLSLLNVPGCFYSIGVVWLYDLIILPVIYLSKVALFYKLG